MRVRERERERGRETQRQIETERQTERKRKRESKTDIGREKEKRNRKREGQKKRDLKKSKLERKYEEKNLDRRKKNVFILCVYSTRGKLSLSVFSGKKDPYQPHKKEQEQKIFIKSCHKKVENYSISNCN